jgi:tRNA(Ile)-lysidine synthase
VARDAVTRLTAALAHLGADAAVAVAFSGGLDSTLLLHAVARLARPRRVRALHIDHALHSDSARWAAHCRVQTERLGVPLLERRIAVVRAPAQSLEDAARRARYDALAEMLEAGEVLLTAHHADDQLETLLYRLFRGTGIRGLRGIADREAFGPGQIMRPLLTLTRAEIHEIAAAWGLEWVEDPMNRDCSFDRTYVRREIVPRVRERWPEAAHAAQRLALAARDAEEMLVALARDDIAECGGPDRFAIDQLRALPRARRRNLVRAATRALDLDVPDATGLERIVALIDGTESRAAQWPGGEARRYRGHLFLLSPAAVRARKPLPRLRAGGAVELEAGSLALEPTTDEGLPDAWAKTGLEIAWRCGGERFRPLGAERDRPLNQWFQEHGIVPWMRERIPLIVHDQRIVAIADLALSEHAVRARASGAKWRVVWRDRPRVS